MVQMELRRQTAQPDKIGSADKWLSWLPPVSQPEPMWWHAADAAPQLVEPEPPGWAYKDPNPLTFDKTMLYGDVAAALRVDVLPHEVQPHPAPPANDFVFGGLGALFDDGAFAPGVRADGMPRARRAG
jgi:hypothetical protein